MALTRSGIRPQRDIAEWSHGFVQSQFSGQLVSRRKQFPAALRATLPHLLELRKRADYEAVDISPAQATRAVARAREFVEAVVSGGNRL